MLLAPRRSAASLSSLWPFLPLAGVYVVLLLQAWSPDTLSIMMPGSLQAGLSGEGGRPLSLVSLAGGLRAFTLGAHLHTHSGRDAPRVGRYIAASQAHALPNMAWHG